MTVEVKYDGRVCDIGSEQVVDRRCTAVEGKTQRRVGFIRKPQGRQPLGS